MENKVKTPWYGNTGGIPTHVEYPTCSIYEAFRQCANKYPNKIATEYLKVRMTYRQLLRRVDKVAAGLRKLGVKENESYYAAELSMLPELETGEDNAQVFLTKFDGDIQTNNFISSLKKIK